MPLSTLELEQNFLEIIEIYPQIGICFFDPTSRLKMETYIDDPQFRDMLIEYQRQRIHELQQSERLKYLEQGEGNLIAVATWELDKDSHNPPQA